MLCLVIKVVYQSLQSPCSTCMVKELFIVKWNESTHKMSEFAMNLAIPIMYFAVFSFINKLSIWVNFNI